MATKERSVEDTLISALEVGIEGSGLDYSLMDREAEHVVHEGEVGITVEVDGVDYYVSARRMDAEPR